MNGMRYLGISLGLINCNGGETLRDCLQSVAHLVDEMIVVDTGSTDDSPDLTLSNINCFQPPMQNVASPRFQIKIDILIYPSQKCLNGRQ